MLTADEYRHLKQGWSVLKDHISDAKNLRRHHHDRAQGYGDLIGRLKLEEDFYTNFLKDAIEEYELAHPPEEME